MSAFGLLMILAGYMVLLVAVSWWAVRTKNSNAAFFVGNRQSPWYVVAFGMIGATMSGVSLVSVPGMVRESGFTYLQMVLGFFFGYMVVAYVLLPLYYRMRLTTIYGYLRERFGVRTYKTGATYFVVAKMVSAASKLYVVALVLQRFVFDGWGVPFVATVAIIVALIWLYTHRGGIRSIVWTDCLQTAVLLLAVVLIVKDVFVQIDVDVPTLWNELLTSDESRVWVMDDWHSSKNFFKQFVSGIFVVIVMTGLDQDMMQKNLSCRTLPEAQRNMMSYGAMFLPINLLFLVLGFGLLMLAEKNQIMLPATSDEILPFVVSSQLGQVSLICFLLGMVAASFSSADSALTSITTSVMVDLLGVETSESKRVVRKRKVVHLAVCVLFFALVMAFDKVHDKSILDLIYTIVGYLYGPLLGLYAFGLGSKRKVADRGVPWVAGLSPLLCFAIDEWCAWQFGYEFGYELLMINGMITFVGLFLLSKNAKEWK